MSKASGTPVDYASVVDPDTDAAPGLAVVLLHREPPPLRWGPVDGRGETPGIVALAHALATTPTWSPSTPLVLAIRSGGPHDVLAAIGRFDEVDLVRLQGLRTLLATVLPRVLYFDHAAVERSCERLAELLREELGAEALAAARFVAVPRGGWIVMGLLSYALGLRQDQIGTSSARGDGDLVVVVDDCAITGSRLSRYLADFPARRVAVATLVSPPDLRHALRAARPAVSAFVSPYDLTDLAPHVHGDGYHAWRERWSGRANEHTLWLGHPEHVAFPWSEPDIGLWNDVLEEEEVGWHLVPPEFCLAHRAAGRNPAIDVQVQPSRGGAYVVPPSVIYGVVDGSVVVGDLDGGRTFELDGSAAAMWHALTTAADEDQAVADLGRRFPEDVHALRADLAAFAAELVDAGALVRRAVT